MGDTGSWADAWSDPSINKASERLLATVNHFIYDTKLLSANFIFLIDGYLYFIYEMLAANLQVAYDVITPKYFFKPGIVRYPLQVTSDLEINLLSAMISLTP